jgi:hypothetical protein
MKSKLPIVFAFAIAAGAALPFAANSADKAAPASPGSLGAAGGSSSSVGASAELSLFQQLDANKDGVVDKTEVNKSAQAKSEFKALDINADGKISAEEWVNGAAQPK